MSCINITHNRFPEVVILRPSVLKPYCRFPRNYSEEALQKAREEQQKRWESEPKPKCKLCGKPFIWYCLNEMGFCLECSKCKNCRRIINCDFCVDHLKCKFHGSKNCSHYCNVCRTGNNK